MNKDIIKKEHDIKDIDYIGYSFVCESHNTKKDSKEILKKITSIKDADGNELISKISLSMQLGEVHFEKLIRAIFKTMGTGVDHHIIPRTMIKNWNITKKNNESNLITINRNKNYNKINDKKLGYKNFMSKDFYFVRYFSDAIIVLETGFINIFDELLTSIRIEVTQSDYFNDLLTVNMNMNNKVGCFLIDKGNPFYNKLLFLYFFHWAISHTYEKSQDFIGILAENIIDYSSVENIISSLLYYYSDQLSKYITNNNMFIMKIDNYFDVETPLGNLFSLNVYYEEKQKHFAVSPLSPTHYLVISDELDPVLSHLSHKENIETLIKEYILQNIIGYYDKNFVHFVYKSDLSKKYFEVIFDSLISDLVNQVNIQFPLEYYSYTIRELIDSDKLDIGKISNLNLKYNDL